MSRRVQPEREQAHSGKVIAEPHGERSSRESAVHQVRSSLYRDQLSSKNVETLSVTVRSCLSCLVFGFGKTRMACASADASYAPGIAAGAHPRLLSKVLGTVTAAYLLRLDDDEVLAPDELRLIELFRKTYERGKETVLMLVALQQDAVTK